MVIKYFCDFMSALAFSKDNLHIYNYHFLVDIIIMLSVIIPLDFAIYIQFLFTLRNLCNFKRNLIYIDHRFLNIAS